MSAADTFICRATFLDGSSREKKFDTEEAAQAFAERVWLCGDVLYVGVFGDAENAISEFER